MIYLLCPDIIKLLIEQYFGVCDSLALFCTSRKFYVYHKLYNQLLLDAHKGIAYCILNGKLDACKFLYSKRQFGFDNWYFWCFRASCGNGHLEISRWLVQIGIEANFPIDIHVCLDHAFKWSCENNHLDVAHWLIQLGIETHSPVDIHANYDNAFRWSCYNRHLNVACWLIQLGMETDSPIDIHSYNDEAFKYACYHRYLNIANWLIKIGIETNSPIDEKIIEKMNTIIDH